MREILVLPRECFHGLDGFVPWTCASKLVESVADSVSWMPRPDAERSEQWVQPIPCAIFRDGDGRYCVFRQASQQRRDLSRRISFVVGGHIDNRYDGKDVHGIFEETVKREAQEEVKITLGSQLKPVGMVTDSSSMAASRHIGFIYEVVIDTTTKIPATKEFSRDKEYHGQFFSVESLSRFRLKFDPWSFLLFSQYLNGGFSMDIGRQPMLFTPTE